MTRNGIAWILVVALLGLPVSCSSSDNNQIVAAALVLGLAVKGEVANASATLYELHPTGAKGRLLGSTTADANGRFQLNVDFDGWAVTEITGGTTTDFRGVTGTIGSEFPLLGITNVQRGQTVNMSATVLSTLAFLMLKGELVRGSNFGDAVENVEYRLAAMSGLLSLRQEAFGAPTGPILFGRQPILLTGGTQAVSPETNYGALADGFCEMAIQLAIDELELAFLIGADLIDGLLDGNNFGRGILSSGGTQLPNNTLNVLWPSSISNFLLSGFNQSGLDPDDIPAINALQAVQAALGPAPVLGATSPNYAFFDQDTSIDLRGFNLPSASDTRIAVGGAVVDPTDIEDTPTGLRFNLRASLGVQWVNDLADLKIEDTRTGFRATERLAALRPQLQPTVSWFGPTVAAASGGTLLEIVGMNLHAGTTVTIDSQTAMVVGDGAPFKITVATPGLSPGTYSVTLSNGQGTTNAGSVTVKEVDLTADETETDNNPQLGFAFQIGYNPDKFASAYRFEYDWQNADVGTSQITRDTVRENATAANRENFPNVGTFRARCGDGESILNNGDGINFFINQMRNGRVRSGNGPDAITFGWERPTDVTRQTVAGTHYVVTQQWDFEASRQRYMYGWMHLDEGGVGSITLHCLERALDTAIESTDILCGSFDWDIDSAGKMSWTPRGFTPLPNLEAYFSGDGNTGVGLGTVGNSVVYGTMLRLREGQGLDTAAGSWLGHRHRERIEPGFTETRIGVEYSLSSRTTIGVAGLEFFEEVTRDSVDTNDRFDWRLNTVGYLVDGRGILRDEDTGFIVGATLRDNDFGIRIVGGIDPDNFMFYGSQVFAPGYQTDLSVRGRYGGALIEATSAGDTTSAGSSTAALTLRDYDPDDDPTSSSGHTFGMAGRYSAARRTGQTIDRDASRNVTISPFDNTDNETFSYAMVGRHLIEFQLDPHVVRRSGAVSPYGMAIQLSDQGAGNTTSKGMLFKMRSGGVSLDGNFRAALIEKGYDLGNGDLNLTIQDWSAANFGKGSFTASGTRSDVFENQTTNTGGATASGSATMSADGVLELDLGGRFFMIVPYDDGQSFVGINSDTSGRQSLFFGTKVQTTAPTVGNFRKLRLGYSFNDFGIFPPGFAMSSGVLKEAFLSSGQVNLTGAIADHTNQTPNVQIFQNFNSARLTYGNDGAATSGEGTGPERFGGGAPTIGYDTAPDLENSLMQFSIRMRW